MSSDERYNPTSLPVEWHGGGRKEEPDAMSASQVLSPAMFHGQSLTSFDGATA